MRFHPEVLSPLYHARLHHPIVDCVRLEANPYLTLPFRRVDVVRAIHTSSDVTGLDESRPYKIQEGFFYSRREQRIHGKSNHGAIDYYIPYGTPVVAPCDGIAVASYHSLLVRDRQGKSRQLDGKNVYYGLGYFVQIWASNGRIVQLAHLADIDTHIPFSIPTFDSAHDSWNPTNHDIPPNRVPVGLNVAIRRGDPIGITGFSGLRLGYDDYLQGHERPLVIDPSINKSWDIVHLHLEEATRDVITGKKVYQRDPYDIYGEASLYPDPFQPKLLGRREALFILDNGEMPKFSP